MHDRDESGREKPDRHPGDEIPRSYLNKLLIRDFERIFRAGPFRYRLYPVGFSHRCARWTRIFLHMPFVREFVTAYFWALLLKPAAATESPVGEKCGCL
jgi:hypothetical protein